MRPFFYIFILFGLLCLLPPSISRGADDVQHRSEKVKAVETGGFFYAINLYLNSFLGTLKLGDLLTRQNDDSTYTTHTDDTKTPQWLLNGLNLEQFLALGNKHSFFAKQSFIGTTDLLGDLDINLAYINLKKDLYDADNFEYKLRNNLVLLHAEKHVKKLLQFRPEDSKQKINAENRVDFEGKQVTNSYKQFDWNQVGKIDYEQSLAHLNIAYEKPVPIPESKSTISYLNKTVNLPLELYKVRTALEEEFYVLENSLGNLLPGSYTILESTTLATPYQEFIMTYSDGERELIELCDLMIMVETLSPGAIVNLMSNGITPVLLDSPPLSQKPKYKEYDPLGMVYRNTRGASSLAKDFSKIFLYEKMVWKSPNNKIIKYVSNLHRRSRKKVFDFYGSSFSYKDIVRYLTTKPIAKNYTRWTDYVFAFSNKVQLVDENTSPTLIMHRSKPIYKDQRTTIFITTFSIVQRNQKEKRVLLTGNKNETIYMISNTFADGIGDNYLEEPIYTLTYDPMPSHPTWQTPIRVTNFGVFIHSGEHAKRFAGCKGLSTHFDFEKRTTTKAIARRTMWQVKGLHDRLKIQKGKFFMMTESVAPGSPPLPDFVKGHDPEAVNMDFDAIIDEDGFIRPFESTGPLDENPTPEELADPEYFELPTTENTEEVKEEEKEEEKKVEKEKVEEKTAVEDKPSEEKTEEEEKPSNKETEDGNQQASEEKDGTQDTTAPE